MNLDKPPTTFYNSSVRMVQLACWAMKCRFEIVLFGEDERRLHSIAEEAIGVIRSLEKQLNFYSPASELSYINRRAVDGPVRVEPRLFGLLAKCLSLWELTGGSFDPTVGPLQEIWGWFDHRGRVPGPAEREMALERVGMDKVELDPTLRTVRFIKDGVTLNLSSVGKGYALERVLELLNEYEVKSALIHGGTSSVAALGTPPNTDCWTLGIANPGNGRQLLARAYLQNQSLSLSGNHVNRLLVEGSTVGHVLDPKSGAPAGASVLAAVATQGPTEADALSTALLCLEGQLPDWTNHVNGLLLATENSSGLKITLRPNPAECVGLEARRPSVFELSIPA